MLKIAICEDDKQQQQIIERLTIQSEKAQSAEIVKFDSGEDLVKAYNQEQRFSIILLDMQMKELNGIQTAEMIRKSDKNVIIIIITSILEYAVEGYSINAFEFILKPIEELKFSKIIDKAIIKLNEDENKNYIIQTREKTLVLRLSDIVYVESNKKKVTIHGVEEVYVNNENITEVEKKLSDEGFVRISRFYLVNMQYIKEIRVDGIKLTTGINLNYSEKLSNQIKERYMNFMMGDM